MTRRVDLQQRKELVLGIVVDQYIRTVTPVGSACIVQQYHVDCSTATIRNILAELEEEGYLTHPHTSAGRIPTQRGYRYYVDHLMTEIQLLEGEKKRIEQEYRQGVSELEKLLEKASQVISDVTHYTSIVTVDGWDGKLIYRGTSHIPEYPETQDLEKIRNILRTLEEKKLILQLLNRDLEKRIEIYIGHEMACKDIEGCSLAVSRFHQKSGPSGRIAILGPTRMDYERVVSALEYISELMSDS